MASVAIFKLGQQPQYLKSVNTPDYEGDPDVIIEPNVSAVLNVELKFWKKPVFGKVIEEMTTSEKQVILDAELLARKAMANDYSVESMKIVLTALVKVINVRLNSSQKITKQEMIDALKAEIT